jgi:betaine-aldehyde dehydrogenase
MSRTPPATPIPVIYPATGGADRARSTPRRRRSSSGAGRRRGGAGGSGPAMTGTGARPRPAPRRRDPARAQPRTVGAGDARHRQAAAGNAGGRCGLGRRCAGVFRRLAASLTGEHIPLGGDFAYTMREPLGVCVGIGAWNYPIQIACWKAAPALACGNAMVFKPSKTTPLSALKLAEILVEAGAPPGVFNVVQGAGAVGAALVATRASPRSRSPDRCPRGARSMPPPPRGMKHVTMELGGKSPLIVFDDAERRECVSAAINGEFLFDRSDLFQRDAGLRAGRASRRHSSTV